MAAKNSSTTAPSFTAEERAAMKDRARELKAEAKGRDSLADQLAKIKELGKADREMATRIQELVTEHAPKLVSKTWYGMPAYCNADGKTVCFFQPAEKFGARYATFGFNDSAMIDDGQMWPVAFAITELTPAVEKKIIALVKKVAD